MSIPSPQPDLFPPSPGIAIRALARRTDPSSSQEAAERVTRRGLATTQAQRILVLLRAHPSGLTAAEIDDRLFHDDPNVVAPKRLPMLERQGLVYRAAERRQNHPGGVRAQVWKVQP